jgi:hypothetical protein
VARGGKGQQGAVIPLLLTLAALIHEIYYRFSVAVKLTASPSPQYTRRYIHAFERLRQKQMFITQQISNLYTPEENNTQDSRGAPNI